jgi:cell division protein ZapA
VSADQPREVKGGVAINLMGREFRVSCREGEEASLLASVEYVNRKMREIRDNGKVVGNERIALMAALNIAHEFLSNPGKPGAPATQDASAIRRRISVMQETLEAALAADQENLF